MSREQQPLVLDERAQRAVAELQGTIAQRYPTAQFEVARAADDPNSVHLIAVVDVDDPGMGVAQEMADDGGANEPGAAGNEDR